MIKFSGRVCVQRFLSSRIDYQTNFVIGLLHYMCTDALCTYVYVYGPHVMPIFCPGELSPARLLDLTKKGSATRFLIEAPVAQHFIPGAICRVASFFATFFFHVQAPWSGWWGCASRKEFDH